MPKIVGTFAVHFWSIKGVRIGGEGGGGGIDKGKDREIDKDKDKDNLILGSVVPLAIFLRN